MSSKNDRKARKWAKPPFFMNTNIMDSPITSLKPGRTLSMTHERHGRACDGRALSVKFNLAEKVKSDPDTLVKTQKKYQ